ncbi:hypothetical protein, partial [Atlantibacter hermannii]|uniref:hypothetical protein n=1 Tax=Atlantibacter hermannii TaxID=565 RepID=UPI001EE49D40
IIYFEHVINISWSLFQVLMQQNNSMIRLDVSLRFSLSFQKKKYLFPLQPLLTATAAHPT